jgi:hypothetical protein
MSQDMAPPFKVFGLQRTGTNLLHALLTRNFHVRILDEPSTGWKHGPLRVADGVFEGQPAKFALCVKNPYAWAVSCYRYFQRCKGGDPTMDPHFRQDPSKSFEEFVISPSYSFQSPIHRWNQMHRLWLATLPKDRTLVVRQEDQLADQMPVLIGAEKKLGLRRRMAQLQPINEKVDVYLKTHGQMNQDYYLDRQYMLEYTPCLLEKINGFLDPDLMKLLAYEFERWTLQVRQINDIKLIVRPCTPDAADSQQYTFDPYHLKPIRDAGVEFRSYLDIGAGIGAATAWVRSLWPKCRVIAYEACPDRLRVLRINGRGLGDVTGICAAITDGSLAQVPLNEFCRDMNCNHAGANATISATSFEKAAGAVGEVDLLRIGSASALPAIMPALQTDGIKSRIRRICGRLPSDGTSRQVVAQLSKGYRIQSWPAASGDVFLAESSV